MRIIAKRTLREFWAQYPDSEQPLFDWYKETRRANWPTPVQVRDRYADASIISGNRVVFNIKGNTYRLVVNIDYQRCIYGSSAPIPNTTGLTLRRSNVCGLKPIRTEEEYEAALARVKSLMNSQLSGHEAEEFDLLVDLVELYEFRHIPMPAPDLAAAIKYRLEEQGWTVQKLDSMIGDCADVGAILSGRKPMTMPVAIGLHKHLGLDEEILLKGAAMRY